MKKMMIMSAAMLLAAASSTIAAPAFIPTGHISTTATAYTVVNSFIMGEYSTANISNQLIPANTADYPYQVSANDNSPMPPQINGVNTITFTSVANHNVGCVFQFVYKGNNNFQVTSLTKGCQVQNNKDLILP